MRKIFTLFMTICIAMTSCVISHAAETVTNEKQNFASTGTAYYNLLDVDNYFKGENNAIITYGYEDGIGKTLETTASAAQYGPRLCNYTSSTPSQNLKYFAFMYKYNGTDVVSNVGITYTNSTKLDRSTTLKGDGNWRLAILDFSEGTKNVGQRAKYFVHTYTNKKDTFAEKFTFANYNIFLNNPLISEVDLDITPEIGASPKTYADNGENYVINSIKWTDENNDEVSGNFEKGHIYTAEISITANENYVINDNSFKVNGAYKTTVESVDSYLYQNTATILCEYDTINPEITETNIENGSEDINVINTVFDFKFNRSIVCDENLIKNAITISPSADFDIEFDGNDTFLIKFKENLMLNTEYTLTLGSDIVSVTGMPLICDPITFTTAQNYPSPQFLGINIENDNVPVKGKIALEYDIEIDESTLSKDAVVFEPAVNDYRVSKTSNGFEIELISDLDYETQYTLTVTDKIKSIYDTPVDEKTIDFKTVSTLKNLIENGYLEDPDISMFLDAGAKSTSLVKENEKYLIKFYTSWANAPILQLIKFLHNHVYLASATIKSDVSQTVVLSYVYDEGGTNTYHSTYFDLKADEWTTVYATHKINGNENLQGTLQLISKTKGSTIHMSEFTLFDSTLAPLGKANLMLQNPTVAEKEVNPNDFKINITSDIPLNPQTVKSGIQISPNVNYTVTLDKELKNITLSAGKLAINQKYTITSTGSLKTMAGEAVNSFSLNVATYSAKKQPFNVIVSNPADAAIGVGISGLVMNVEFDDYVDASTLSTETVFASGGIINGIELDSNNPKAINILFNSDLLKKGETYTITLSDGIKNFEGYPLNEKEISFTLKTDDYILNKFNEVNDAAQMKEFCINNFSDLFMENDLYDYLSDNCPNVIDKLENELLGLSNQSDVNELKRNLKGAILKSTIRYGNENDVNFLIESNFVNLKEHSVFDIYADILSSESKQFISTKLKDENTISPEVIAQKIILEAILRANGWNQVKTILEKGLEYFPMPDDASKLLVSINGLTNGYQAYNKLQGYDAQDLSDIYRKLQLEYKSILDDSERSGNTGGGKSSNGSKSSGFVNQNYSITGNENTQISVQSFSDVSPTHWAYNYIEEYFKRGIISGMGNGLFMPDLNVKREEFAKLIMVTFDIPVKDEKCSFLDITKDDWSYPYVSSAAQNDIIHGMSDTSFGLGKDITREDIAVMIFNVMLKKGIKPINQETDLLDIDSAAEYSKTAIRTLKKYEIITGDEEGRFNPKFTATRAEATAMLYRAAEVIGGVINE